MPTEQLDAIFGALADATRRAILERLAAGEASVKELSEPFTISPPAITKHLKVLERARLISRRTDAQWRLCRLDAEPLREVADWLAQYRRFWEGSLDNLEGYLREIQSQPPPDDERQS